MRVPKKESLENLLHEVFLFSIVSFCDLGPLFLRVVSFFHFPWGHNTRVRGYNRNIIRIALGPSLI